MTTIKINDVLRIKIHKQVPSAYHKDIELLCKNHFNKQSISILHNDIESYEWIFDQRIQRGLFVENMIRTDSTKPFTGHIYHYEPHFVKMDETFDVKQLQLNDPETIEGAITWQIPITFDMEKYFNIYTPYGDQDMDYVLMYVTYFTKSKNIELWFTYADDTSPYQDYDIQIICNGIQHRQIRNLVNIAYQQHITKRKEEKNYAI